MTLNLLVFDSHPVQYRVPIWQAMEAKLPGCVHVVYGSDCSVRGHADKEFGKTFAWDEPLLSGYQHTILNCEKGEPLTGWSSLTGAGVKEMIDTLKPKAILLTGLNYKYDLVAYRYARKKNISVWLRCETQDESVMRSKSKAIIRSLIYRIAYLGLSRVFYIGELNKQHYLAHGVAADKLKPAYYGTVDRFENMNIAEKESLRQKQQQACDILPGSFVIGFSGKFIEKKNPDILYKMLEYIPENLRSKIHLYFLGSGALETDLKSMAHNALQQYKVKSYFAGFVNQTALPPHYLAMDVMVLPSRRMGETWGLVANEAMQAGCGVIVSDAVGSGANFKTWERFRIFKEADAVSLANSVIALSSFERDFDWAKHGLKNYSIEATADAFINEFANI